MMSDDLRQRIAQHFARARRRSTSNRVTFGQLNAPPGIFDYEAADAVLGDEGIGPLIEAGSDMERLGHALALHSDDAPHELRQGFLDAATRWRAADSGERDA